MGASMMLLSQTRHLWQFVLFLGVLGALGFAGLAYSVTSPTIAKWFVRRRGRAAGIATGGLNVGVAVFTPLIVFLIDQYGWRSAWLYLGLLPMVLVIPPALLWLRRQPEDMGLLPDGDPAPPATSSQSDAVQQDAEDPSGEVSWSVQDAFRSRNALAPVRHRAGLRDCPGVGHNPQDPVFDRSGILQRDCWRQPGHPQLRRVEWKADMGIHGRSRGDPSAACPGVDGKRGLALSPLLRERPNDAVPGIRAAIRTDSRQSDGTWDPSSGPATSDEDTWAPFRVSWGRSASSQVCSARCSLHSFTMLRAATSSPSGASSVCLRSVQS